MLPVQEPHFENHWYIEFRGSGFDSWDKFSYSFGQGMELFNAVSLLVKEDYKQ